MARHRRSRSDHKGGGRPREARANIHSRAPTGVARLTEEALYSRIENTRDILLLILDGVQDPHNLGACLRSAEGAGVAAVVVPRHKASPLTETVIRISCGGASRVPVVPVGNMARFLEKIREDYGIRVLGTADQADCVLYDSDLTGALALVLGAEETGIRRLTAENCDVLIRIPMAGEVECLNVSNAAAVCLFEAVRQRNL